MPSTLSPPVVSSPRARAPRWPTQALAGAVGVLAEVVDQSEGQTTRRGDHGRRAAPAHRPRPRRASTPAPTAGPSSRLIGCTAVVRPGPAVSLGPAEPVGASRSSPRRTAAVVRPRRRPAQPARTAPISLWCRRSPTGRPGVRSPAAGRAPARSAAAGCGPASPPWPRAPEPYWSTTPAIRSASASGTARRPCGVCIPSTVESRAREMLVGPDRVHQACVADVAGHHERPAERCCAAVANAVQASSCAAREAASRRRTASCGGRWRSLGLVGGARWASWVGSTVAIAAVGRRDRPRQDERPRRQAS